MKQALFLNGVFEAVLEEIAETSVNHPDKVYYLQPHSTGAIARLRKNPPTADNKVPIYISTTKQLDKICYVAEIVGWEEKQQIERNRLDLLNSHIEEFQPSEQEIYMKTEKGKSCVNLLSIVNFVKVPYKVYVTELVKTEDDTPLKPRQQSGHWSYVYELPGLLKEGYSTNQYSYDKLLEDDVNRSSRLSDEQRKRRLEKANPKPEQIQIVSKGYKRNGDVVAEVLKRANGICERCGKPAPFKRARDGSPFLEIHHRNMLADRGDDTVENAMAVCPNCHRELHFGQDVTQN